MRCPRARRSVLRSSSAASVFLGTFQRLDLPTGRAPARSCRLLSLEGYRGPPVPWCLVGGSGRARHGGGPLHRPPRLVCSLRRRDGQLCLGRRGRCHARPRRTHCVAGQGTSTRGRTTHAYSSTHASHHRRCGSSCLCRPQRILLCPARRASARSFPNGGHSVNSLCVITVSKVARTPTGGAA